MWRMVETVPYDVSLSKLLRAFATCSLRNPALATVFCLHIIDRQERKVCAEKSYDTLPQGKSSAAGCVDREKPLADAEGSEGGAVCWRGQGIILIKYSQARLSSRGIN